MPKLVEMDSHVSLSQQLDDHQGPVVLINKFEVQHEDVDRFLETWAADAAVMKRQPGFISTQLHRGIRGSTVFLNYAVWESTSAFKQAFLNPEFQSRLKDYPASAVVSPHLFTKLAVPGICVA